MTTLNNKTAAAQEVDNAIRCLDLLDVGVADNSVILLFDGDKSIEIRGCVCCDVESEEPDPTPCIMIETNAHRDPKYRWANDI